MVERLLSKPEVRGAIPRISKVKDLEQLIKILQKTTDYWSIIQEIPSQKNFITSCLPTEYWTLIPEIPSQKIYNLLFADWNKSFLDSTNLWGCSSNGRALALHARGTGSDALDLEN